MKPGFKSEALFSCIPLVMLLAGSGRLVDARPSVRVAMAYCLDKHGQPSNRVNWMLFCSILYLTQVRLGKAALEVASAALTAVCDAHVAAGLHLQTLRPSPVLH